MQLETPDLIWCSRPRDTCLTGAGPIEETQLDLDIEVGDEVVEVAIITGHCEASGITYGLLPMLSDILNEFGHTLYDATGFVLDGEPAVTGVVVGPGLVASWDDFVLQQQQQAERADQPAPDPETVRALDVRDETWTVGQAPAAWMPTEDGGTTMAYAALVLAPDGQVRAHRVAEHQDGAGLADLVRRATTLAPAHLDAVRPAAVRVADDEVVEGLRDALAACDIAVEHGPTPALEAVLSEVVGNLRGGLPSVFAGEDPDEVRAYFEAARRFYDARPWTRTEGDRFLGFRIDDGDWHYASVMGQMEASPGLSLFEDWPTLCRFFHTSHTHRQNELAAQLGDLMDQLTGTRRLSALEAAGAMEGVTLDAREEVHPDDIVFLDDLGIEPLPDGYPSRMRMDAEDGPVAPRFSLATYGLVMRGVVTALERRRATPVTSIKTTLDIDGHDVELRYPADGQERPWDGPPAFRLTLDADDRIEEEGDIWGALGVDPDAMPAIDFVVEAPATALLMDVAQAMTRLDESFFRTDVQEGEAMLWNDRNLRRHPSPRVGDLLGLDDLSMTVGMAVGLVRYRLGLTPLDAPVEGIDASMESA
jgi:hypothetical protein